MRGLLTRPVHKRFDRQFLLSLPGDWSIFIIFSTSAAAYQNYLFLECPDPGEYNQTWNTTKHDPFTIAQGKSHIMSTMARDLCNLNISLPNQTLMKTVKLHHR